MPSEIQKTPSTKEQDDQSTGSVFDFLYYDARRVGSFLSQFDNFGHLQALSRKEAAHRGKSDTGHIEASGGFPGLAQAKGHHQHGTTAGRQQESTSTYDPYWTNALSLLDYLQEREMLSNGVDTARIGQLALFAGELTMRDLRLIQKAMALPSMKTMMGGNQHASGSRQVRRQQSRQGNNGSDQNEFGLDFLSLLPHSVQMEFQTGGKSVWATLQEESMVVSSSDLFLKHGVSIPGEWYVLGVVDAVPSIGDDASSALANYETAQENIPGEDFGSLVTLATKGFAGFIDGIVPFAKLLLGRRDHQYGVTPLLIFRQVAKQSE